jgi:hypothetical protein
MAARHAIAPQRIGHHHRGAYCKPFRSRLKKRLAEFIALSPHCLMGDDNATLSQKQLDVAQAEAEHVIQAHGMANDRGGNRWR